MEIEKSSTFTKKYFLSPKTFIVLICICLDEQCDRAGKENWKNLPRKVRRNPESKGHDADKNDSYLHFSMFKFHIQGLMNWEANVLIWFQAQWYPLISVTFALLSAYYLSYTRPQENSPIISKSATPYEAFLHRIQ